MDKGVPPQQVGQATDPILDENIKITLLNAKNAEKTLEHEWNPWIPEKIPGTGP